VSSGPVRSANDVLTEKRAKRAGPRNGKQNCGIA
jgi:hypothetical protein